MATTRITIVLLVVLLMAIHGVSAQSPAMAPAPVVAMVPSVAQGPEAAMVPAAAGPSTDCMTYIYNMTDCLSYVESGSNLTEPDKPCCGELAALVDNNPICLCQLLSSADSLGLQIDVSKSLKLPSVCGVSTPSVSLCSAVGYPVAAPTSNDESVSPGVLPPVSATTTTGPSGNGASSIAGSALAFLVGLAIAFLPTIF